jgi:hypothetical protein
MVLRALDGELLGKRMLPKVRYRTEGAAIYGMETEVYSGTGGEVSPMNGDLCIATIGRNILTWRIDGNENKGMLELFDPWAEVHVWPAKKFAPRSKTAMLGHEAVGVLEPDGHFLLLELPGGRTIADLKLQPEESLAELFVMHNGNQYFILTNSNRRRSGRVQPMQAIPGTVAYPIRQGRLYAMDERGKLTWPSPATIEDQYFLVNQPVRLPLLTLACQRYEQRANNAPMTSKTRLLCIDKRTGRKLYQGENSHPTSTLEVVGNPEKKTVELRMQNDLVTLTFTDKPIPPTPPGQDDAKHGKIGDALWNALNRSLNGTLP